MKNRASNKLWLWDAEKTQLTLAVDVKKAAVKSVPLDLNLREYGGELISS